MSRKLRWALLVFVCGVVGVASLIGWLRKDVRGGLGTTLVYDDFAFTLVGARKASSLLGGELVPKGVFEVVEIEVQNDAKRVDYELAHHRVLLYDSRGGRHEADAAASEAYAASVEARAPRTLHPGEACRTTLVFDVPANAECEAGISWGGTVVDALDRFLCGERRFVLP